MMTDEKYVFTQDVRDKKITARSARHKRAHNGKGGAVKLPSDYMTKKELNAMNGEVKSYRLNNPMKWHEFKSMPDDIKVSYIKLLRAKYNVPARQICEMLGVSPTCIAKELARLGLSDGHTRSGRTKWDKEGWFAFVNGVSAHANMDVPEPAETVTEAVVEVEEVESEPVTEATEKIIPCCGNLCFVGSVDDALKTVAALLGGANARINIAWELADNG